MRELAPAAVLSCVLAGCTKPSADPLPVLQSASTEEERVNEPKRPALQPSKEAVSEPERPAPRRPRLIAQACDACASLESGFVERCLYSVDGEQRKALGCGETSPAGGYGVVVVETGSTEEEDWSLAMKYVDATGETIRDAPGCRDEPGFDCESPGRFLGWGDGRYVHLQGSAGDGTNDNAILDLAAGKAHPLTEGEYSLVLHGQRPVVGFASVVPNHTTEDGVPAVRVVLGCFDLEAGRLTQSDPKLVIEDEADSVFEASPPVWVADELVLRSTSGPRFSVVCE